MSDYSSGIKITWQIAANEAAYSKHQFIEKEHIFIALCKVGDYLKSGLTKKHKPDDVKMLEFEVRELQGLFSKYKVDEERFRRYLRKSIGKRGYKHASGATIHRSEECRKVFQRAGEIASQYKSVLTGILHILYAIMEAPGDYISNALIEFSIKRDDFKNDLMKALNIIDLSKSWVLNELDVFHPSMDELPESSKDMPTEPKDENRKDK